MTAASSQHTLAQTAKVKGVGIHTGERVTMTLGPAEAGEGIVFRRTDLGGKPTVPATVEHVDPSRLDNRTTLQRGAAEVQTAEHVLAALVGMGVDNARIDLTGPECPGVDNSALPCVEAIEAAGTKRQRAPREPLTLTEPITVRDEERDAEITAVPSDHFAVTHFTEFPEGYFLTAQTLHLRVTPEAFRREVAPARTWIFAEQIPGLLLRGLGQGGTKESVLVIGKGEYVTEPRFEDEPVRHKALDLIGDLALLGRPLHAHVMARRSGHALHAQLVRRLLDLTA